MAEEEIGELYTHLAFQYESSIEVLLAKGSIDNGSCYCNEKEIL